MKVKNVIKGHLAHEAIERITIIDLAERDAIYSGTTENWINVRDCMKEYKREVENTEVIKSVVNCGGQLFIFIPTPGTYYPPKDLTINNS